MNKMRAIVALLVLVASVGNSNALPRDAAPACTEEETQNLQVDVLTWAQAVLELNPRPKAAAASVIKECDANGDGTLTVAEFVACLHSKFDDVSDSCFAFLESSADANGDGEVSLEELTGFFSALVKGARMESEQQNRRARRSADDESCSLEDSFALRQALSEYLLQLLEQGPPEVAAKKIVENCDADENGELSIEEFIECLSLVVDLDISESCYELLANVDENGDGDVDVNEITMMLKPLAPRSD